MNINPIVDRLIDEENDYTQHTSIRGGHDTVRTFKVGDRVITADPDFDRGGSEVEGTIIKVKRNDLYKVQLDDGRIYDDAEEVNLDTVDVNESVDPAEPLCCVMAPIKSTPELEELQSKITDEDIYEPNVPKYGRESDYHVTVLFGLVGNPLDDVSKLLGINNPATVSFAKVTSIFENDRYDVVKVDATSEDLAAMNKDLVDNFEVKTDHPDFHPHLTLAYVKKGEGKKYDGLEIALPDSTVDTLVFSDGERNKTDIPLLGVTK